MNPKRSQKFFPVGDYDLTATLSSGQAFRWRFHDGTWESVIDSRWIRLRQSKNEIIAETAIPISEWNWIINYLQLEVNLPEVISTFPGDEPMRAAVKSCHGLRLLRQNPWECLASFILSSTKQIVQIQQIVGLLCDRFGQRVVVPNGHEPMFAFPTFARLAQVSEAELRSCKMGFRAPYLLATAKMLVSKEVVLENLHHRSIDEARSELLKFSGVGNKIADCVLLFAYGFPTAFPVDVWVMKALRELYFPKRRVKLNRLQKFSQTHFGPNAGYAQQYLFHYMRTRSRVS
ncbi:MAG: DNA glycosylase [Verrucomicrobiota bacterium]